MIRWIRRTLCTHLYVAVPHWLLDAKGNRIGKANVLTCSKCGHMTLIPYQENDHPKETL